MREHPESFHRDAEGHPVSSVPAWTDIIDLDHTNPELARYLVDSLAVWVRKGVDGFRCDGASLIPLESWIQARTELARIKPGLLWVAESVHPVMVENRRAGGQALASDAEIFEAFDVTYTWDVWGIWQAAVTGRQPVGRYLEMLRWQDASLPANYAKLRHVENHDNFRIMRFAPSREQALAWTALMAFSRGPLMFYAGQESAARKWPSLFEPDPVQWGDYELADHLTAVAALEKHPAQRGGALLILADEPCVQMAWGAADGERFGPVAEGAGLYGVFDVAGAPGDETCPSSCPTASTPTCSADRPWSSPRARSRRRPAPSCWRSRSPSRPGAGPRTCSIRSSTSRSSATSSRRRSWRQRSSHLRRPAEPRGRPSIGTVRHPTEKGTADDSEENRPTRRRARGDRARGGRLSQ